MRGTLNPVPKFWDNFKLTASRYSPKKIGSSEQIPKPPMHEGRFFLMMIGPDSVHISLSKILFYPIEMILCAKARVNWKMLHVWAYTHGAVTLRAASHTSQEPKRKCPNAVVPTHLQDHVVWSRILKCSVKSYVTGPSTKC